MVNIKNQTKLARQILWQGTMLILAVFSENLRVAALVVVSLWSFSNVTEILCLIFRRGSIVVDAKIYITNMTDDKRLKICEIADNLLDNASMAHITGQKINKLSIKSLGNI